MRLQLVALVTLATSAFAAPAPQPWCMRPAQPCWKLKRAVDAINKHAADTLPPHDGVQERAAATPTDLDLFAASAYDHLVHLAANASPDPDAFYEQHRLHSARRDDNQLRCAGDGAACWARGAEQSGEVEKRWCMRPAQPCWKTRRAAESILNAGQEDDDGASEECGADDGECANAKRHLDGLHQVAREIVKVF